MLRHSDMVCVKKVPGKGRGVFARCFIAEDMVIERVPVLLVPIDFIVNGFKHPQLGRFFYLRGRDTVAVALGYGSLYNHSYYPNAIYEHENGGIMIYRAIHDIEKGEEVCVNYNGDPEGKEDVGFKVVETVKKALARRG